MTASPPTNGDVELVMNGRNTLEDEDLGPLLVVGTFSYLAGDSEPSAEFLWNNSRTQKNCTQKRRRRRNAEKSRRRS